MIMLAPLDIMHERSFYSQFLFKYNDYMHICYFRLYPSRSIHPSSHPHNNPHTDSPSNLLCLLPVLPQQYRLDQLHVQVAILSHFSQDPAVLPCGVADHGGVVSVGDNEGVQDVQEQPLVYVRVLVARQELEEEVVQAQVGDQIPDEDGIVVEEVDQIAQQSHYLLLDSQSFLIVCPDQQRQMYILEDAEGQFLIIDQQIVEQSDSQDGWIGALSIQQVGIDQMGYLCVEKWEIVYCLLENVGDVDQKPQALDQRPFSVVAFSWLLNKESFQSPKDYILQKVVFLVEYALSEARFKELHISQLMRLYVFCLLGVEFSTEQVIADAQQSQSSLGCQLLPAQELYRPDEGSQLQLVQHSQEVSASEAILQTVLGDLLALVRIILIAFLQYLRALQCSQQSMFYHYSCLLARDVDQHSLQDVHVVSPLGQFKPHHFLGYLFDLSNNGGSGGMQVFIYMLGQLENGCWQVVDELMGLFYCLILEFFCVDEASADTGEVGGQFLSADGPVVGLSLQEQLTAFAPAWLSGALPQDGMHYLITA